MFSATHFLKGLSCLNSPGTPQQLFAALRRQPNSTEKSVNATISYAEQRPFKTPQLPALRAVVSEPAQQKRRFFLLLFLSSPAEPQNRLILAPKGLVVLAPPLLSMWAHRLHTARSLLSVPGVLPSPPKPYTTLHRRQGLAAALETLTLDPRRLTPFHESLLYSLLRRNFCWSCLSKS